jgi:hypothetical protein
LKGSSLITVLSRYWKRKLGLPGHASYRTACDLDFFRGEVGTIDRPDALDDCDPKTLTGAKWKAFSDVGMVESMSRERWGASKWVRCQLRVWAVNPNDPSAEPNNDSNSVPHTNFMEIIEPIFNKDMDYESKLALLKRSCVIVATADDAGLANWLYYRFATEDHTAVRRIQFSRDTNGSRSLVNSEWIDVIKAWKDKTLTDLPENHDELLAWEEEWMNAVMSKGALAIPRLSPVRVAAPGPAFAEGTAPSQPADEAVPRVSVAADNDGIYRFPVLATGTSSTRRTMFKFGRTRPTSTAAIDLSPVRTSAPSSSSSSALPPPNSTSPAIAPIIKRIKVEPGTQAATSARAAKAAEIEKLRVELANMPSSPPPIKKDITEIDDDFRAMVQDFVDDTKYHPVMIDDSPPKRMSNRSLLQALGDAS